LLSAKHICPCTNNIRRGKEERPVSVPETQERTVKGQKQGKF
jgi:hypothetical protein